MIRIDIHSRYRLKFMISWLCIFIPIPIISIILLILSKLYLVSISLLIIYLFIALITFYIGNRISKGLKYQYIILDVDYFEIEDKYGSTIRLEKVKLYPGKNDLILIFLYIYSLRMVTNQLFVESDITIDYDNEKINCYISFKSYKLLKKLDYKYLYKYK